MTWLLLKTCALPSAELVLQEPLNLGISVLEDARRERWSGDAWIPSTNLETLSEDRERQDSMSLRRASKGVMMLMGCSMPSFTWRQVQHSHASQANYTRLYRHQTNPLGTNSRSECFPDSPLSSRISSIESASSAFFCSVSYPFSHLYQAAYQRRSAASHSQAPTSTQFASSPNHLGRHCTHWTTVRVIPLHHPLSSVTGQKIANQPNQTQDLIRPSCSSNSTDPGAQGPLGFNLSRAAS